LPVVDRVAADYDGQIAFVAVAGRSSAEKTRKEAAKLLTNVPWGLDDGIWQLYGVPGQPASILISAGDVVVDGWFGGISEASLRAALDRLVAVGS